MRLGAGGKPLALLSWDCGQGPSGCLVHGFLSGARPGSPHRVDSPWLVLISGQDVFLCAIFCLPGARKLTCFTFLKLRTCEEVCEVTSWEKQYETSDHFREPVGDAKEQRCRPVATARSPSGSLDHLFPNLQVITTFLSPGLKMPSSSQPPSEFCHSI